jgi:hypothetical protein
VSANCGICRRPFVDTFGPVVEREMVIDVAIAHPDNGIERQFPAESILSWKGKVCANCVDVAYELRYAFDQSCVERRGYEPVPTATVQTSWWRRLFGGA